MAAPDPMTGLPAAPILRIQWEDWADRDIPLPTYATSGAAGADLHANFPTAERAQGLLLAPMARVIVPTGFRVSIPEGFELQVRPRSGLALKHGISMPNAPGTIDSDYRGPLGVLLINLGDAPFPIAHGDRIAQAIVAPVAKAGFVVVDTLDATQRGTGGFGSTGRR